MPILILRVDTSYDNVKANFSQSEKDVRVFFKKTKIRNYNLNVLCRKDMDGVEVVEAEMSCADTDLEKVKGKAAG